MVSTSAGRREEVEERRGRAEELAEKRVTVLVEA